MVAIRSVLVIANVCWSPLTMIKFTKDPAAGGILNLIPILLELSYVPSVLNNSGELADAGIPSMYINGVNISTQGALVINSVFVPSLIK